MTVKPHAALFWLLCARRIAGRGDRASAARARPRASCSRPGSLAPGAVFGWLGWRGGLGPFVDDLHRLRGPALQPGRAASPPWQAIAWHSFGRRAGGALLAILAVLALVAPPPRRRRKGLAAVGRPLRLVHFVVQGKGWEYQLYPLAALLLRAGARRRGAVATPSVAPACCDLFGARRVAAWPRGRCW